MKSSGKLFLLNISPKRSLTTYFICFVQYPLTATKAGFHSLVSALVKFRERLLYLAKPTCHFWESGGWSVGYLGHKTELEGRLLTTVKLHDLADAVSWRGNVALICLCTQTADPLQVRLHSRLFASAAKNKKKQIRFCNLTVFLQRLKWFLHAAHISSQIMKQNLDTREESLLFRSR